MNQNIYINEIPSAELTIYDNGTPVTVVIANGAVSQNKVPYTGATQNVNLGEYGISAGFVQLDTTPTTYTPAVGNMGWNDSEGTIDLLLKGGVVSLPLGQKQVARVVNGTGGNVLKSNYQVVKVTGAQGQRLQVNLAQANNDANSADTLGLIAENINNNNSGFIITSGLVENINTTGSLQSETWTDGNILYLSPTTPGAITNVKPQAPNHTVIVGFVVYAHSNNGKIFVKVDNGYELDELHNVLINTGTLANGQVLKYNSSLQVWENNSDAGITGSGTSGQVAYWNGTTTQTGSNNLFWDAANNRLGVGTNAPARTFDVNGLAGFTGTTASDGGQLGSELLSSANWTLNSGWTGDFVSGFAHSSGTATLTNTLAAVTNSYYLIAYTVTGRTAGSFSITFGGTTTSGITATGSTGPRATSTASLVITPTTDFNGTIVFSIKVISTSSASIQLRNSSGTVTNEIRNDSSNTNTLIGTSAGSRNLGTSNTFIGNSAGSNNTTAINNTFVGRNSGAANILGASNSFFGTGSGQSNTTGGSNSFFGLNSGSSNTTAGSNSFFGLQSGLNNTTGGQNSFFGAISGLNNTTGSNNVAIGLSAGRYISSGSNLTVANNSVFLGFDTRANADSETNQLVVGYQAIGLGSNTSVIGNSSTTFGRWWGNLLIGSSVNGGQALQVTGDTLLKGSGNTSATTALTVQNSDAANLFRVRNDGVALYGSGGAYIAPMNRVTSISLSGEGLLFNATGNAAGTDYAFAGNNITATSGALTVIGLYKNFLPTSGTATYTNTQILPTINQTGGANGITRGLYVNPTLTAAADWRSIEWSNNTGWGLYGAGTANNYLGGKLGIGTTTIGDYALNVSGNKVWFQATDSTLSLGTGTLNGMVISAGTTSSTKTIQTYGGHPLILNGAGNNVLIGTTTDAGQKLQVTGTTLLNGALTVSSGGAAVTGLSSFTGTTASDGGQLGSELLSSANWTLGAGWTGDFTTGFAHSSGTATLTNTLAAVTNNYYLIAYTVTGRTAGSFSITFGGTTTSSITATGSTGPRATSTASLVITPTTDFDGTIVFSIKVISASSASIQLRSSSGTVTNEIRNDSSNTNTLIGISAGSRNFGTSNTFIGRTSGQNNTTGILNTFIGRDSGLSNTTGSNNSFFGVNSGLNNITGESNSFFGISAGLNNTTGGFNSFFGRFAGLNNTTGTNNIGFGREAGRFIASGAPLTVANNSTFLGVDTRANADSEVNQLVIGYTAIGLGSNTSVIGNSSTTFGRWWGNLLIGTSTNSGFALDVNGTARIQSDATINGLTVGRGAGNVSTNTVAGASAGAAITTGSQNVFVGFESGKTTSTGASNTFFGYKSGELNQTGNQNSHFGAVAGTVSLGSNNSFIGHASAFNITSGSNNCFFGQVSGRFINSGSSLTTLNNSVLIGQDTRVNANSDTNEIVIGYQGRGNGSNTTTIGNTSTTDNYIFGNFNVTDANNIILGTTTGTKIGTATSQKLGFWNATPIVQPTTGVASATRVGGGGTTLTDTDTFDGYSLAQIVKALRNTGILA